MRFWIPLLLPFLLVSMVTALSAEVLPGPVPARVLRVIDGDSLKVEARLWPGLRMTVTLRLAGIDAPEQRQPEGQAARDFLVDLLATSDGNIALYALRHGKYAGRIVGQARLPDGRDLGCLLLAAGHARPYPHR
ncbi:thermonuclease family protein [Limibacillus sp. MBR-115]|jgi:endonuclease YncB( thermonuclease family)|uniref:thermonuclease family protein n=1 Tax=Limibacillus sp. MBR-115 TaxID=3156465 RepID=UPI00339AEDAA